MAEKLQYSFERCCRLCAEEQDVTIMLFGDEAEAMLVQKKIKKYLLIEIQDNDRLPKNVCIQCCNKLQTVCEFIDRAHEAKEILTKRSLILEDYKSTLKSEDYSDNESNATNLEVSVDPMIVLQNSDEESALEPVNKRISVDVTHLHDVDGENVTIKLIRNGELGYDDKNTKVKPFPCKSCDRSFHTELALKNHSWIHIDEDMGYPYNCKMCTKVFENKTDFIRHVKQHKLKKGLCQLCGRMFRSEKTYIAHMTVHSSMKASFTCKVCGHSYNTWSRLQTHSISHSNERPYICNVCKKSFKRKQDLKFHVNQHTGDKPYKCPFCDKSFASFWQLLFT